MSAQDLSTLVELVTDWSFGDPLQEVTVQIPRYEAVAWREALQGTSTAGQLAEARAHAEQEGLHAGAWHVQKLVEGQMTELRAVLADLVDQGRAMRDTTEVAEQELPDDCSLTRSLRNTTEDLAKLLLSLQVQLDELDAKIQNVDAATIGMEYTG